MAKPASKDPKIVSILEVLSKKAGTGAGRLASITNNVCVLCGKPALTFKDSISKKEFAISGACQKCQDFTFGPGPEAA